MADETGTKQLIAQLGVDDWGLRHQARDALLDMGPDAVEPLAAALSDRSATVRWEAAKVLERLGDAQAIPALVGALEDPDGGIRYLAAEALGRIGDAAALPVLRALLNKAGSPWFQEGAHHVLRICLAGDHAAALSPVVVALEGPDRTMAVLPRVGEALKTIEGFA